MRYELIATDEPHKLDEEINKRLADGWQLYGSPNVCAVLLESNPDALDIDHTYIQAVVKKEESDKPQFMYGE